MNARLREDAAPPCCNVPRAARAFSLVEVAITMGIIAFMVLPLVSLAIYAQDAIQESTAETHASDIAQRVFTSLSVSTARSGLLFEAPLQEDESTGIFESLSLAELSSEGGEFFLLVDTSGRTVERADATAFEEGYRAENPTTRGGSFVHIRVLGTRPSVDEGNTVVGGPNLFHIEVAVQAPALAPRAARRSHSFHAFLKLSDSVIN